MCFSQSIFWSSRKYLVIKSSVPILLLYSKLSKRIKLDTLSSMLDFTGSLKRKQTSYKRDKL